MASLKCTMIVNHLAAFHLAVDESARAAVESHLLSCQDCLAQYFAMKHAFDAGAVNTLRPDPAVRRRLRAHFRSYWAPYLVAGLAAAAALVAVIRTVTPAIPMDVRAVVDSASPVAQSLNTL